MNILLIRLRLIGDVVFTTPAVTAIRRRFPHARITYLVEAAAEPVVRHHPAIDQVVVVERPHGLARWRYDLVLGRQLRADRYDLVIDFHGGPRSALLAWMSGAPQRIGYALPGRWFEYTTRVPWTRSLVPPRHSVINQWALLEPLGIAPPDRAVDPVVMPVDRDAQARVSARLQALGVDASAQIVVMHVSAGNPFRRWPAASFAQAAALLAQETPARRVVLTSGPSEREAADAITAEARRMAGDAARQILHTGEFDLSELHALVARSAVYIGGDSGPMHVAATTGTPMVALFGPTLPERSMPWRDPRVPSLAVDGGPLPCRPCHQRHCEPGDFRCLTSISPTMVVDAARTLLAGATGHHPPSL